MRKKLITFTIVMLSFFHRPIICMARLQDCLASCILGCMGLKQKEGTLSTIARESVEGAVQETEEDQTDKKKNEQENTQ